MPDIVVVGDDGVICRHFFVKITEKKKIFVNLKQQTISDLRTDFTLLDLSVVKLVIFIWCSWAKLSSRVLQQYGSISAEDFA